MTSSVEDSVDEGGESSNLVGETVDQDDNIRLIYSYKRESNVIRGKEHPSLQHRRL